MLFARSFSINTTEFVPRPPHCLFVLPQTSYHQTANRVCAKVGRSAAHTNTEGRAPNLASTCQSLSLSPLSVALSPNVGARSSGAAGNTLVVVVASVARTRRATRFELLLASSQFCLLKKIQCDSSRAELRLSETHPNCCDSFKRQQKRK